MSFGRAEPTREPKPSSSHAATSHPMNAEPIVSSPCMAIITFGSMECAIAAHPGTLYRLEFSQAFTALGHVCAMLQKERSF